VSRLAIVGLGYRAVNLFKLGHESGLPMTLQIVVDPDESQARSKLQALGLAQDGVKFLPDLDALAKHVDEIDGILIGTRCHLHAPLATEIAALNKPLFLEKPVAINAGQISRLASAYRGREDQVVVSFPMRHSPLFRAALEIVQSGRLGTINQITAVNHVPYGGIYFGEWYRNHDETGNLWLQKATHDFDTICTLVDAPLVSIVAAETRRVFGGDMPAGLRCSECSRTRECLESPQHIRARGGADGGAAAMNSRTTGSFDHACLFSEDIHHHDSGTAILRFSNGVIASYNQNFVTRNSAGKRGAILTGYNATLEYEFTAKLIRVVEHHSQRVDTISFATLGAHSGGDIILLQNFCDVMKGIAISHTPLTLGIQSAAICLAATQSIRDSSFIDISSVDKLVQSHTTDVQTV